MLRNYATDTHDDFKPAFKDEPASSVDESIAQVNEDPFRHHELHQVLNHQIAEFIGWDPSYQPSALTEELVKRPFVELGMSVSELTAAVRCAWAQGYEDVSIIE